MEISIHKVKEIRIEDTYFPEYKDEGKEHHAFYRKVIILKSDMEVLRIDAFSEKPINESYTTVI